MSDPILILYPYTWIDRFMSRVTSPERTQAFTSDAHNGTGGTKIDRATLLRFRFIQTNETPLSYQSMRQEWTYLIFTDVG